MMCALHADLTRPYRSPSSVHEGHDVLPRKNDRLQSPLNGSFSSVIHSGPSSSIPDFHLFTCLCLLVLRWLLRRADSRTCRLRLLRRRAFPPGLPGQGSAYPNIRRSHFRCVPCIRRRCRCLRPFRCRRSIHAVPHLLGRLGWARWRWLPRTARQACSDLRGGSRTTNQYHSSDKRLWPMLRQQKRR